MTRAFQPFLQIRHNSVLVYDVNLSPPAAHRRHDISQHTTYTGKVTNTSQRRILSATDILLQRSPQRQIFNPVRNGFHDFRINFVTLTLASQHNKTAREGYDNCLKPFLRTARRKWNVTDYIWKAELQNRGQLHYHITTNQFIHLDELRTEWNKLQKRAGWLDDFARKHKHFNPNSTDVHAVWKVKNLGGYLAKYLSKVEPTKAATIGKVWDCSKELKRKRFSTELKSHHIEKLEEAVDLGYAKEIRLEHCVIFETDNPAGVLDKNEVQAYKQFLT